MSDSSTPPTPPSGDSGAAQTGPSAESVNKQLAGVEDRLSALQKRLKSSARTTAVIGTVLIVFIFGYFTYGYSMISSTLEPKQLVDTVETMIDTQIPELRSTAEEQIRTNAPVWAEELTTKAIDSLPGLREQIEDFAMDQFDEYFAEAEGMTEKQFRKLLSDNQLLLEKGFEELGTSKQMSQESIASLEIALEKELGADMREQAAILLETLSMLSDRIKTLQRGTRLTKEERLEREILMLARRLQLESADPSLVGKEMPTVSGSLGRLTGKKENESKAAGDGEAKTEKKEAQPESKKNAPKADERSGAKTEKKADKKKADDKSQPKAGETPKSEGDKKEKTKSKKKDKSE